MARTAYVADTSVFSRLTKPSVAAALAPLAVEGRVAVCPPVAFELGYAAHTKRDYIALMDRLASFPRVPATDADHQRALEVQGQLNNRSQRRALSLVDALVAAIAEASDLIVLHYDADFELVHKVTGQPHEWIVKQGTAD